MFRKPAGRVRTTVDVSLAVLAVGISATSVFAAKSVAAPTISAGPAGPWASTTASFTFSSPQAGATYECSMDSASAFTPCSSPKTYTGLSEGAHTFRVRAKASGTLSGTVNRAFTVDTAAPGKAVVTKGPDDPTNNSSAGFDYKSDDSTATFQCSLDGGFVGCSKNHTTYSQTSLGAHCFQVRAMDPAGNVGAASDEWCWTRVTDQFALSGDMASLLSPGVSASVNVRIGNPYNFPLHITSLTVMVDPVTKLANGSANGGCSGSSNFSVAQIDAAAFDLTIPANSSRTLAELGVADVDRPSVAMLNLLDVDQNACKATSIALHYDGQATK
jgi:large repetitive protein